jgi:hypothetical protein
MYVCLAVVCGTFWQTLQLCRLKEESFLASSHQGCYLIFTGMCQALRKTAVPNVPDAICDVPTWPEVGQAYWLNSESD